MQLFGPREPRPPVEVDRGELEHAGAGDDAGVVHTHPLLGLPLRDLHPVVERDRADRRLADEARPDATVLLTLELDRPGVEHPLHVMLDRLDETPHARGRCVDLVRDADASHSEASGAGRCGDAPQRRGGALGRHDVDQHAGATLEAGLRDEVGPDVDVPVVLALVCVRRSVEADVVGDIADHDVEECGGIAQCAANGLEGRDYCAELVEFTT